MPIVRDATLTAFLPFSNEYLSLSAFIDGTVTAPDADTLVLQSADGSGTVTLAGTGLVHDQAGSGIGGVVTAVTVAVSGTTAVTVTGVEVALADLVAAAPAGGDAVADVLLAGNDSIKGSSGDDILTGGAGRDRLIGGQGNDTLIGGTGGDRMTGGRGADTFLFGDASDSAAGQRGRDVITDFDRDEGDLIDLTGLGALSFRDEGAFTGTAGDITATAARKGVLVQVDLDGDMAADVSIMVNGVTSLRASDFALLVLE